MPCRQCHAPWAKVVHTWTGNLDFTNNRDLTAYSDYDVDSDIYPKKTALWRIVHVGSSETVAIGVVRSDMMVRTRHIEEIRVEVNLGQGNAGVRAGFLGIDYNPGPTYGDESVWYFMGVATGTQTHTYRLEVGIARCHNCWDVSWPDEGTRPYYSDELHAVFFEGSLSFTQSASKCPPEIVYWRLASTGYVMSTTYDARFETGRGTLGYTTDTRYPWHFDGPATQMLDETFGSASLAAAKACIVSRASLYATAGVNVSALKTWLDSGNKVLIIDSMTDSNIWGTLGIGTTTALFDPAVDFPATEFLNVPPSHPLYRVSYFTSAATSHNAFGPWPGRFEYSNAGPSDALDGVNIAWSGETYGNEYSVISHTKLIPASGSTTLAEVTFSQRYYGTENIDDGMPLGVDIDVFGPFPGLVLEQVGSSLVVVNSMQDGSRTSAASPAHRVGSAVAIPDRMIQNLITMAASL